MATASRCHPFAESAISLSAGKGRGCADQPDSIWSKRAKSAKSATPSHSRRGRRLDRMAGAEHEAGCADQRARRRPSKPANRTKTRVSVSAEEADADEVAADGRRPLPARRPRRAELRRLPWLCACRRAQSADRRPRAGLSADAIIGFAACFPGPPARLHPSPPKRVDAASAISPGCSMLGTFDKTAFNGSLVQAFDTKSS